MCKNIILNTAIKATLALPRTTLWATTAVIATLSLDAGLAIVGDELEVSRLGTPVVVAAGPGSFTNLNLATDGGAAALGAPDPATFAGAALGASATLYSGGAATNALAISTNLLGGKLGSTPTFIASTDVTKDDFGAIVYAQELFYGGAVTLPAATSTTATDGGYRVVKYVTSGAIIDPFEVVFSLDQGATFKEAHLAFKPVGALTGANKNCGVIGAAVPGSASVTFKFTTAPVFASCSIDDGTELYLAYRIDNAATALKEGKPIKMTGAVLKKDNTAAFLNIARTITVAVSKPAAKVEIKPESGAQNYVFISALENDKKFTSKAPAGLAGTTPYVATDLVKIGYVKISGGSAADALGKNPYKLGSLAGDKATLEIKDGQFAASKGGVGAKGRVYIDAGGSFIEPTPSPLADDTTATFTLNNIQLAAITAKSLVEEPTGFFLGAPIMVQVDGATPINIPETEPSATMTVTTGTTPASTIPVEPANLRRFVRDGKICWVYNVPSPPAEGAAVKDYLTIRVVNGSKVPTKIVGTLYEQVGGAPIFENAPLLDLLDPSKAKVLVQEGSSYLLNANSVVRLDAADIAAVAKASGGTDSWPGTRRVLKIQANVTDLEVLTMIRNTQNPEIQPQSNISTGVTGNSCQ